MSHYLVEKDVVVNGDIRYSEYVYLEAESWEDALIWCMNQYVSASSATDTTQIFYVLVEKID